MNLCSSARGTSSGGLLLPGCCRSEDRRLAARKSLSNLSHVSPQGSQCRQIMYHRQCGTCPKVKSARFESRAGLIGAHEVRHRICLCTFEYINQTSTAAPSLSLPSPSESHRFARVPTDARSPSPNNCDRLASRTTCAHRATRDSSRQRHSTQSRPIPLLNHVRSGRYWAAASECDGVHCGDRRATWVSRSCGHGERALQLWTSLWELTPEPCCGRV